MKKTLFFINFLFVSLLLLSSCAKKEILFVPLKIEWFEYKGDLSKIDQSLVPAPVVEDFDSTENRCFIAMTKILMEDPLIQLRANQNISFDVQYYRYQYKKEVSIHFLGRLSEPEKQGTLETEPMVLPLFPKEDIGAWTARCNPKGQIKDFAFNGQKTKRQRPLKMKTSTIE